MRTMVYVANSVKGGIKAFVLNRQDSTLEESGGYMTDDGVAPLAISPDRRFLYAAIRTERFRVAAFTIDSASGELHFLNAVPVPAAPTYMSVDGSGRFLLFASYSGDLVCVMALGREGMAQPEPVCLLRPGRNPHCIVLDASNRFAYVPLLGNDQIVQYRFDAATGALVSNNPAFVATLREAGPRHLVLQPDNRFAYLLTELGGEVVQYVVNRDTGALTVAHGVPLLPPERALPPGTYQPPHNRSGGGNSPTPVMWAADIRVTPDSRYLYASERTGSTLSRFGIDSVSGRLDLLEVMATELQPRAVAMDPFGRYLLAAGEQSNHVSLYHLSERDGALSLFARHETGKAPTWIEVVVLQ